MEEKNHPSFEEILRARPFFTVKEFAELCGRSVRWAYDRVYSGDVQVMEKGGVTAIASEEIRRFLSKGTRYRGKRSTPSTRPKQVRLKSKRSVRSKTPNPPEAALQNLDGFCAAREETTVRS
jgi:hypothetical protein